MSMRHALLEEPPPTRHWDDPDLDEAPATSPEYTWTPAPLQAPSAAAPAQPPLPSLDGATLLVASSPVSMALAQQLLGEPWGEGFSLVGSLSGQPSAEEGQPGRREAAEGAPGQAQLYRHQGNSRTFLALADSSHVAAPDCFLWTRAFFQGAAPARVLIFGPLPPGPFHSQLRIATGQEDIAGSVFRLCTAAHQEDRASELPYPFLPPGTLIDGLPAAILSHCQAKSVDATLWCCGFADASPGGDMRSSLDAFAAVLDQLAPSLALDLPSKVPVTAVTKALNVLKKKSTLPSDMYI